MLTTTKTLCSSDKNGYYISINKNDYEIIETSYSLTIFDYDTCSTAGTIDSQPDKLRTIFDELRKIETDFSGIAKTMKRYCSTYDLQFEII